jgi:hypothetical protein
MPRVPHAVRPFIVIGSALVLVLTLAAPVSAGKPTRETFDLDDPAEEAFWAEVMTEACGVPVAVDFEGSVRVKVWTDKAGGFKREIDKWFIRDTFTNLATGASILLKDVGPDHYWISKDGHLMLAITGRSLTGSGVIGRVVIDLDTGETVHSSGKEVGSMTDQVCGAIA